MNHSDCRRLEQSSEHHGHSTCLIRSRARVSSSLLCPCSLFSFWPTHTYLPSLSMNTRGDSLSTLALQIKNRFGCASHHVRTVTCSRNRCSCIIDRRMHVLRIYFFLNLYPKTKTMIATRTRSTTKKLNHSLLGKSKRILFEK